jgi:hypothetical protein
MSAVGGYQTVPAVAEPITAAMLESLGATKGWVRFLSILGYLYSLVMLAIGVAMALAGPFIAAFVETGADMPAGMMIAIGILYVLLAILYLIPSTYLFRYASAISQALRATPRGPAIERALKMQKSFWKFAGIMTLIAFVAAIIGIIAAITIPTLMMMRQQ